MTTITLKALLEVLLGMQGTFVLCNAHGSLEFKGQDLYLSSYEEWLTVYHATPPNPESQSHLHLKWHTFQRAVVTRDVPDHALVFGQPAKIRGWVCTCARRVVLRRTGDGIEGWCAECQQAVRLPAEAATIGR